MIDVAEKKYTIRIPDELHAQLKRLADQDMRSLHSQIIILLREAAARRLGKREKKDEEQP